MPGRETDHSQTDIDAVLAELATDEAFDAAERRIAAIAPQLQSTLDSALAAGGWFDDAHESAVLKTATTPDDDARIQSVRNLVLEQTRLGMLVGVAVGWELADRLAARQAPAADDSDGA